MNHRKTKHSKHSEEEINRHQQTGFQFLWTQLRSRATTWYSVSVEKDSGVEVPRNVPGWIKVHPFTGYFLHPPLTWQYRYLFGQTPEELLPSPLFIASTCRRMIFPLKFPNITDVSSIFPRTSIALGRPFFFPFPFLTRENMKCSSSGTLQSTIETVTLEWRLEWLLLHGDRKNCGVPLHSTVRVLSNAME